jgi:hypothetical protein
VSNWIPVECGLEKIEYRNFFNDSKVLIRWSNRVSSQVLILLPECLVAKHRIYDYQQLPHESSDRNLVTFTCSSQALIEPLNGRIVKFGDVVD